MLAWVSPAGRRADSRGGWGVATIGGVLGQDGSDVVACGREIHGLEEGLGVGAGLAVQPADDIGAASVVIGEGEDDRLIGVRVAFEDVSKVPGSGQDVAPGVEEIGVLEGGEAFGPGPFLAGEGAHLHEAELAGLSPGGGTKAAFPPDHGLDQGAIDAVAERGLPDEEVHAGFESAGPPPAHQGDIECGQGGEDEQDQGAPGNAAQALQGGVAQASG